MLKRMYVDKVMSMQDIADVFDVSRMTVYNKLKEYKIPIRTKSAARLEGIKRGRIEYRSGDGKEEETEDRST